jgi:glycosyltransferase involved in cell wall biosynthesis
MDPQFETAAVANDRRSLFVLIPMLNEAANLPKLMASMRSLAAHTPPALTLRVVIVDDGSTDGTAATAEQLAGDLSLTVLRHERRRGPGCAFATGFTHLARILSVDDYVVTTRPASSCCRRCSSARARVTTSSSPARICMADRSNTRRRGGSC